MTLTARELSAMKLGERELGGATLMVNECTALPLHMRVKTREIGCVFVKEAERGKGLASKLMEHVCREADKADITLLLSCPNSLRRWYGRFGFMVLQDNIGLLVRQVAHPEQTPIEAGLRVSAIGRRYCPGQ